MYILVILHVWLLGPLAEQPSQIFRYTGTNYWNLNSPSGSDSPRGSHVSYNPEAENEIYLKRTVARLLSGVLLCLFGFWDPVVLPVGSKGLYFIPKGCNSLHIASGYSLQGLACIGANSGVRMTAPMTL